MANTIKGTELWEDIATTLNDIILNTGKKIDINNPTIWDDHLHRYSNQDWLDMLAAFAQAIDEDSELAKPYRKTNLQAARAKVLKASENERPLDRKSTGGKKIAWAMINTLRETWNEIQGIDIPNEDAKPKSKKNKVTTEHTAEYTRVTIWHNLFDLDD